MDKEKVRKELAEMVEDIMYEFDRVHNHISEKYYDTLHKNGIEDSDVVFDIFTDIKDGYDDVNEIVNKLMGVVE